MKTCTLYNIGKRGVIKWSRTHFEMYEFVVFDRNGLVARKMIKLETESPDSDRGPFSLLNGPLLYH